MNFCEVQQLLQDSPKSRNVFNTLFYGLKIDNYLEQHRVFEILTELLIRVCIDRPENVVDHLCEKLKEISQKHVKNAVLLEFINSTEEGSRLVKALHHLPLIECVNKELDASEMLSRLEVFLKSNLLHKHCLIICNFKGNRATDKKILRISRLSDQAVLSQNCDFKPRDAIDIPIDDNHRLSYIYQNIHMFKPNRVIKGGWKIRALIVGRIGSGRKTQGALLAKEFGLVLIDLDYLNVQYQQRSSKSEKHEFAFWGFLQETLLKPDCLHNGYVVVCNVISRQEILMFMEKFICQPNRIIFIHTTESECLRRLKTKDTSQAFSVDSREFLSHQMNLYDLHKKEFVEFFKSNDTLLHIKGTQTIHEIKTLIWANLV